MKTTFFIGALALLASGLVAGQELPYNEATSKVVHIFQKAHPDARDVDWDMEGNLYKVEFENGYFAASQEIWYDSTGKVVKTKQKIAKKDLPQKIKTNVAKDFKNFRISEVKKITEKGRVIYELELDKLLEDWKVAYDSSGKMLAKFKD